MPVNIRHLQSQLLSDNWSILKKNTFELQLPDGSWQLMERETHDHGNGSTVLLYNRTRSTILLTRQFRLPTFVNGNPDGLMLEAPGGLIEGDPEETIKREVEEETGYRVPEVEKIFEAYMSPGTITELVHFYLAEYTDAMKVHAGGGLKEEQEFIEIVEVGFDEAFDLVASGRIKDGKTILLLQHAKLAGRLDHSAPSSASGA